MPTTLLLAHPDLKTQRHLWIKSVIVFSRKKLSFVAGMSYEKIFDEILKLEISKYYVIFV